MNPAEFRLLIHHHDVAYVDTDGSLWLSAWIGRWVESLGEYFQHIGLLLHQSDEKTPHQDTRVCSENVHLLGLGPQGRFWDRISRMRRIHLACQRASLEHDGLLIRGVTPRQHSVWRYSAVPHKAFLQVGSIRLGRSNLSSVNGLYSHLMSLHRQNELQQMARNGVAFLANSPQLVCEIKETLDVSAGFVPTNSIRADEFIPFEFRGVTKPWRLLYCGRLDIHKGLLELFGAVAVLNERGYPSVLDIVGLRTEPTYSKLLTLADQLGISKRITWHGRVAFGDDLFHKYQQSDVLILPSYMEGFPHVIWEAAANCCPVITTHVGGIPTLWRHGTHGWLIPPRNTEAIVDAVIRILNDHELRRKLVENAYLHAQEFTVEKCASRLADTLAAVW